MTPAASLRLLVAVLPIAAVLSGFAQPGSVRTGFEFSARYSHTTDSALEGIGPVGSVEVGSWQAGLRAAAPLSESTQILYGLDWNRHALELSGARWLPERWEAVAVPLGITRRWDERWGLLAMLQPRLAVAGTGLSTSGFDLPVLALATYTANPELKWNLGLRYGARSDLKILPLAGVNWKFAPAWEFTLAWPDSGVSYRPTPQLTLRGVAAFHGGDYHLDADPRALAVRRGPPLNDAWLEYREVRVGFSAEYAFSRALSLRADLGKVVSRRFEYLDRDLTLKGGTPTYFALGMVGRF